MQFLWFTPSSQLQQHFLFQSIPENGDSETSPAVNSAPQPQPQTPSRSPAQNATPEVQPTGGPVALSADQVLLAQIKYNSHEPLRICPRLFICIYDKFQPKMRLITKNAKPICLSSEREAAKGAVASEGKPEGDDRNAEWTGAGAGPSGWSRASSGVCVCCVRVYVHVSLHVCEGKLGDFFPAIMQFCESTLCFANLCWL